MPRRTGRPGSWPQLDKGESLLSLCRRSVALTWRNLALAALVVVAVVGLYVRVRPSCATGCAPAALVRRAVPGARPFPLPDLTCPVKYPPLSVENVTAGTLPYLFGGRATGCQKCESEEFVAGFCQFELEGNGVCFPGMREKLIARYAERGFHDILTFTPCDLWRLLAGRTLWFSGDSQTQDFFKALQCFMYEFTDLGWHELDEATGETLRLRQPGFNAGKAPGCVLLPAGTRLCFLRCDKAACMLDWVVPLLGKIGKRNDLILINFGLHFSKTYKEELIALVDAVEGLRRAGDFPFLIWKDTPPQHFDTLVGEYPRGSPKPPFECYPLGRGYEPDRGTEKWELHPNHTLTVKYPEFKEIEEGGWRNRAANKVMAGRGVPVVAGWNETVPLYDYHRDNGAGHECTHYCHPSAPQVWVWTMYDVLRRLKEHPIPDGPTFPDFGTTG